MTIFIDSREKARAIKKIVEYFDKSEIKHFSTKLFVGDYQNPENPLLVIDRKQNLLEVSNNVCQDHDRFIRELKRANEAGIRIIFLVEHGCGIKSLNDVQKWVNPRLKHSPLAMSGERLHKILSTISARYGCDFLFCNKSETGKCIIELLFPTGKNAKTMFIDEATDSNAAQKEKKGGDP